MGADEGLVHLIPMFLFSMLRRKGLGHYRLDHTDSYFPKCMHFGNGYRHRTYGVGFNSSAIHPQMSSSVPVERPEREDTDSRDGFIQLYVECTECTRMKMIRPIWTLFFIFVTFSL